MSEHHKLARLCLDSYHKPDGFTKLVSLSSNDISFISAKKTDTQAYIVSDKDKNITTVFFPGTNSIRDAIQDIKIRRVETVGSLKIHRGFLQAANSIWPLLKPHLEQLQSHKVIFTGHSLGGALATIIAIRYFTPDELVTFGQPRVGGERLKKVLDKINYYRYVNASDIVPRHPWLAFGYRHHGELRYASTNGHRWKNPSWFEMFFDRLIIRRPVSDHYITSYCKKLRTKNAS